jgi:hypothetical protein
MNKFVITTLLLAGFAGFTVNAYGWFGEAPKQPPIPTTVQNESTLVTGRKIDKTVLAFYSPIIKDMCSEDPDSKETCRALVRLACRARSIDANGPGAMVHPDDPTYEILLKAKLIYSDGCLRPEVESIIRASFLFTPAGLRASGDHSLGLRYTDPIGKK